MPVRVSIAHDLPKNGFFHKKKFIFLIVVAASLILIFVFSSRSKSTHQKTQNVIGDINQDSEVNVLDYNILTSCYGSKVATTACTYKSRVDLDRDGVVRGIDYNIFLRGFFIQQEAEKQRLTPTPVSSIEERIQDSFTSLLNELKFLKKSSKDADSDPIKDSIDNVKE